MGRVRIGLIALGVVASIVLPSTRASAGPRPGPGSVPGPGPVDSTIGKLGLVPSSRPGVAPAAGSTRRGVAQFPGWGSCDASACWTPGEPVLAVGPTKILQTVNTAATVYDKSTGAQSAQFDFTTWWGTQTTECVDPRALYIATIDRFAFSCSDITPSHVSHIRFAISASNDPTGAWHSYAAPNQTFLDQDKIEATADKFVVAGNSSTYEQIYVYNLADVAAGTINPQVVAMKAKKSNVYQAAVQQTSVSPAYFVSSYPGGKLYLATITGTPAGGNAAIVEKSIASVDYPAPIEPAVPGGFIGGGDLDGRIYSAIFEVETSDSKPVIQYSSARLCGNRDCISNVRLDLSQSTPKVAYNNLVGEPGWDYSYGAPGLDAAGNVFEVYTRSNSSTAPGMAVVGPGFDVSVQPASSGTTSCSSGQQSPCDERWGDYVGTGIDPSNPSVISTTGLFQQTSGGYGWGTWIDSVSLNRYIVPATTTGVSSSITRSSADVAGTVNPNGVATTYHFDYGTTTGYEASTPEQSAGSGSRPVVATASVTGLVANTIIHYRLVATTSAGSGDGADRTFKTKAPTVTAVAFTGTPTNPTVTITGTFGAEPSPDPSTPINCVAGDTSFDFGTTGLWFTDATSGWTAGHLGDCIGLVVTSFTTSQITYGFGSDYSAFSPLADGDSYQLMVNGVTAGGTVNGL